MSTPHDRLKLARETAGFATAADAARRFHWVEATYFAHENGSRGFKGKAIVYAEKFGVNLEWLIAGKGNVRAGSTVPMVGYVGAGGIIMPDDSNLGRAEAPPEVGPRTEAVIIRGDSQWPAFSDGDLVYCDGAVAHLDDAIGQMCVVLTAGGERMLKMVKRGTKKGLYQLISVNAPPTDDVKLVWAAPVTWVKKRRGR